MLELLEAEGDLLRAGKLLLVEVGICELAAEGLLRESEGLGTGFLCKIALASG